MNQKIIREKTVCFTGHRSEKLPKGEAFGSHAGARGQAVFATCLSDGEKTRWNRTDFVGVLADSNLPDWAREKLQELTAQEQTESTAPELGGMTMQ